MKKVHRAMTRKAQTAYKNALVYMDLGNNYVVEFSYRGQNMVVRLGNTEKVANKALLRLIKRLLAGAVVDVKTATNKY